MSETGRTRSLGPGSEVGGFVIEAIAGRGGMGVVYRARQKRPERLVAVKVITPDLADDPAFRARFERESTIAAQIEHPNVIPVHAVGDDDGVLFIAMRFIAGIDLRTLIVQEGRLEPRRAATIIDQVAQALDAAHGYGLVHRDVKPANVLLSTSASRDHVYLTDFGLSRHVEGSRGVTGTGAFLGTIDYVAPEQARAERVDARTDVYSLGCVLFHALSGTVPFPEPNDLAKLYAHGSRPPPSIRERAPDVPVAFEAVLMRAMAKAPDDRYLSAGDLGRAAIAAASNASPSRAETSVAVGDAAPVEVSAVPVGTGQPTTKRVRTWPPSTGRQRRLPNPRWALAAAVPIALIVAAIVILSGHRGHRNTPRVATSTFPGPSFRGVVLRDPSLAVQQGPATSAPVTGFLPYRTAVIIVCTAVGDSVDRPIRQGRLTTITTPLWDRIGTDTAGKVVGYVPDAWIETGTGKPVAPACNSVRGSLAGTFRGSVLRHPSLAVQQAPTLSAPVTGKLPYNSVVVIVCTSVGDLVSGPVGKGQLLATTVWDKVRTYPAGRVLGFVPDAWVRTGTTKPVAPGC